MNTMKYVINQLEQLVNCPSPTGYTKRAANYIIEEVKRLGFDVEQNQKGGIIVTVKGKEETVIGIAAHLDTLGAMVRSISGDGMLNIVSIGGFMMESIEGSYCTIHTRSGKDYTGTILTKHPSVHTYDDARTMERNPRNMEVRIDELVTSKDEVEKLGISAGDYISFAPNFVYTPSGFIKSRHLDDKASVAVLLGLLKEIKDGNVIPEKTLKIIISNYEEVGHGASYLPQDITEFLAVDMGAIGDDLTGDETKVSICALDSSGPYDYNMTTQLIELAKEHNIGYAVDIFPHYGSDASAALRGGNNIKAALIGQGVHASHGMERTHEKGMENTLKLICAYVQK